MLLSIRFDAPCGTVEPFCIAFFDRQTSLPAQLLCHGPSLRLVYLSDVDDQQDYDGDGDSDNSDEDEEVSLEHGSRRLRTPMSYRP